MDFNVCRLAGIKLISVIGLRGFRGIGVNLVWIDQLLQFLARLEEWNPLGGDIDRGTCLRISPAPRIPLPNSKRSEAPQLDLLATIQRLDDILEDFIDNDFRILLGQPCGKSDLVNQFCFCHRSSVAR